MDKEDLLKFETYASSLLGSKRKGVDVETKAMFWWELLHMEASGDPEKLKQLNIFAFHYEGRSIATLYRLVFDTNLYPRENYENEISEELKDCFRRLQENTNKLRTSIHHLLGTEPPEEPVIPEVDFRFHWWELTNEEIQSIIRFVKQTAEKEEPSVTMVHEGSEDNFSTISEGNPKKFTVKIDLDRDSQDIEKEFKRYLKSFKESLGKEKALAANIEFITKTSLRRLVAYQQLKIYKNFHTIPEEARLYAKNQQYTDAKNYIKKLLTRLREAPESDNRRVGWVTIREIGR